MKYRLSIMAFLSVLISESCTSKGFSSYTAWYEEIPYYQYSSGSMKISIKEYPRELGWITHFGMEKLTGKLLDTLYQSEESEIQFLFIADDTNDIMNAAKMPDFNRFRFRVNEVAPLDVRPLGSGTGKEKYLVIFRKHQITDPSKFIFHGPGGMKAAIPLDQLLIKQKRKLRI